MNFNKWWDKYVEDGREDLSEWEKDVARDAWNAAYEEAAKVCDNYKCDHPGGMIVAASIAREICGLKTYKWAPKPK